MQYKIFIFEKYFILFCLDALKLYSEQELIKRLRSDDQLAFEILFYKYKNKLKGFVIKLAPSQIDPEEIVQKVFIKVWVQRSKIDCNKSFSSFLFTIARNEMIDQLRSAVNKKIYMKGDGFFADLDMSDQPDSSEQNDLEQKVMDLIFMMPERRRQIFELSRFEGLSYKKIAEKLHISENTVDTQIRNALNFLRSEARKIRFLILFVFSK